MRFVAWMCVGFLAAGCNSDDGNTDTGGNDCAGGASRTEDILCLEADTANGAEVYGDRCTVCHGPDGAGLVALGSDIREKTDAEVVESILNPVTGMTDFSSVLSDQEIADVAAHVDLDL